MDIVAVLLIVIMVLVLIVMWLSLATNRRRFLIQANNVRQNANQHHAQEVERKIMQFISDHGRVKNDDVQKLCGVSDAMATKYLQLLENKGKIIQIGKTGTGVFYTKI